MGEHSDRLALARRFLEVRDCQKAAEVFLELVEGDPENQQAWFGLGGSCAALKEWDEARNSFEQAEELGHPRAQVALSELEKLDGNRDGTEAIDKFLSRIGLTRGEGTSDDRPAKPAAPPAEDCAEPTSRPPAAPPGKVNLGEHTTVVVIEENDARFQRIVQAFESVSTESTVRRTELRESGWTTIVGMGRFDVAVLDWDTNPRHARNFLEFVKMKKPETIVVTLADDWSEELANQAFRGGADYCMRKGPGVARMLPFVVEKVLELRDYRDPA